MRGTWPEDRFRHAVATCISVSGVLRQLGVTVSGWNYRRVNALVRRYNLDTSHWLGQGHLRGKGNPYGKRLAGFAQEPRSAQKRRGLHKKGSRT